MGDYSGFTLRMYDPDSPTTQIGSDININSGSARSYTVIDFLDPDDTAKALFSIEPNGSDGDADETAAVKNVYEPDAWATYVYEYPDEVNQADPVDYVASAWENADHYAPGVKANEEDVDPVWDLGWASAGEYKLSLHNLPRHTWVEVNIQITANAGIGNTSVLTATAGVEVLNSHMDDDWGVQEWNIEDQIKHTDSDLDIYFSMSLPTMTTFSFDVVQVFTEIPFVSLSTSGYGTEGGTDATVTVSRQASGEMLDEPLVVGVADEGGTATPGDDYSFAGPVTIPARDLPTEGGTTRTVPFGTVNDNTPEWTEWTNLHISDTELYKVATPSPVEVDIIDDNDMRLNGLPSDLLMNLDDDNNNSVPDRDESSVAGENDLYEMYFEYPAPNLPGATVSLDVPSALKLWEDKYKTTLLHAGNYSWTLDGTSTSLPPKVFYAEAIGGSDEVDDIVVIAQDSDAATRPGRPSTTTTTRSTEATSRGAIITWVTAPGGQKNVVGPAGDVIVGQQMGLVGSVFGPGDKTYSWKIGGAIVKDYLANDTAGRDDPITNQDLQGNVIAFYWYDGQFNGQNNQVSLTATVGGQAVPVAPATFKVYRPRAKIKGQVVQQPQWQAFNNKSASAFKIEKTTLDIPAGFAGTTQWVTLVGDCDIRYQDANGWSQLITSPGLDKSYPHPKDGDDWITDVPSLIPSGTDLAGYDNTTWTDYYMFIPSNVANPIPVPLRRISRRVQQRIDKLNGAWQVKLGSHAWIDPQDADSLIFPEWNHNVKDDNQWQASNAPPL
jgi:hypothetical protein